MTQHTESQQGQKPESSERPTNRPDSTIQERDSELKKEYEQTVREGEGKSS